MLLSLVSPHLSPECEQTLFNIIKTAPLVSLLSDKPVKTQLRCTDLVPGVAAISSHPHIRSPGQRAARVTMGDYNANCVADTQRSHGNGDTPTGTKPVVNVKGTFLIQLKGKQSSQLMIIINNNY